MKIPLAVLALIALSACSEAKSVAYYDAHVAERGKRLDACIAASDFSHNCRNVRQSQFDTDGIAAQDGVAVPK